MAHRILIAANWKMNKTVAEAVAFAGALKPLLPSLPVAELLIMPSFFCVRPLADALAGTPVQIGAQDLYWEPAGAFTGEVSPVMLRDAGATHVLVGHSERRHVLGETDAMVARKLGAALTGGLTPLLCVGETLAERDAGRHRSVVEAQLAAAFDGCTAAQAARVVLAYEPVWAIGTGRTATPADAADMHATVRAWLGSRFQPTTAERVRILYGGSVRPDNAGDLLRVPEVDGLLVGGASLEAASFAAIVGGAPA